MQGIRWMIAEMRSKLNAIRWVAYRAATLKDQNAADWMTEAATAKMFVVPAAMEIVELSRRIHGAYGYTKEFKIERLYRAIAGASAIAVSLEINKSITAASLL
jgi:alkylation response protein AidB-like acyl-CoA dehydrogenase